VCGERVCGREEGKMCSLGDMYLLASVLLEARGNSTMIRIAVLGGGDTPLSPTPSL